MTLRTRAVPLPPEPRFWSKVDKHGPVPEYAPELGPCWIWTAGKFASGYGAFRLGTMLYAHRVAYEWLVGLIPPELQLDHLCRVRSCVNPAHLEMVTSRENTLRGIGFAAANAVKLRCPSDHVYDETNTKLYQGRRYCRACRRDRVKKERAA